MLHIAARDPSESPCEMTVTSATLRWMHHCAIRVRVARYRPSAEPPRPRVSSRITGGSRRMKCCVSFRTSSSSRTSNSWTGRFNTFGCRTSPRSPSMMMMPPLRFCTSTAVWIQRHKSEHQMYWVGAAPFSLIRAIPAGDSGVSCIRVTVSRTSGSASPSARRE